MCIILNFCNTLFHLAAPGNGFRMPNMEAVAQMPIRAKNPATRQVLVNIGNRYVVFGSRTVLPNHHVLGPKDVRQRFSERVGDEYDFPHERLVQSVQVDGAEVRPAYGSDYGWDIEIIYPDESKALVEIKIRTRDFINREFDQHLAWLREVKALGSGSPEVWNFNIERLRLNIMSVDAGGMPNHFELEPLNVWEFNQDGSTFERSYVLERIADWISRINNVYTNVEDWSAGLGFSIDKSRTVLMSEELMQKFAVPDRDLQILDLGKDGNSLLSFVPVGLWIFGSNGRIDVISRNGTTLLLDTADSLCLPNWMILLDKVERKFEPWNKETFLKLLKAAEAP